MIKAALFDLDSTLVDYSSDVFFGGYMKLIGGFMAEHVPPEQLPPERFLKQLIASIEVVCRNTDQQSTNKDVFEADFFAHLGRPAEELRPLFDRFYADRFPQLANCVGDRKTGRRVVEAAMARGLDIVLATNPIFPRVAIEERMRWIGINDLPWKLVTVYEDMHACKPNTAYYREILNLIGRQPDECLMVGNDTRDDLAAREAGLWTYLVEDNIVDRGSESFAPHLRGRLSDLVALFTADDLGETLARTAN